jgi:uncharacterized membrane protein HdeD (DUF308 family)
MKNSTKLLLLGAVMILLGVIALGNAALASVAVVALTAGMLLIGGGFQIVGGFSLDSTGAKLLAWLTGALMLLLGWSFLANPLQGVISLALLILILLVIGGVARLFYAWRLRSTAYYWPMLASGALSILLAAYILSSPEATMLFLGVLLGVEMLLSGMALVFFGQFLRRNGS